MDESISKVRPSATTGLSIRNGPVEDDHMDIDQPNGTAKRKARTSIGKEISYKEHSDSDDAAPLVRKSYQSCIFGTCYLSRPSIFNTPPF